MKRIIKSMIPVFATGLVTISTASVLTSCFGYNSKQKIKVTKDSLVTTFNFFKKLVTKMEPNTFNETYGYLSDKNKDKFNEIVKTLNLSSYQQISRIYTENNKIKISPMEKGVFYLSEHFLSKDIYINLKGEVVFDNITFGEMFDVVYQNDAKFIVNDEKKTNLEIRATFTQIKNDIDNLDLNWYWIDKMGNKNILNPSDSIVIKNEQNKSILTIKNTFFNDKEIGVFKFICIPKKDYVHLTKNEGTIITTQKYIRYNANINDLVNEIATWDKKTENIDWINKTVTSKGILKFKKIFNDNNDFIQEIKISDIKDGLFHKILFFNLTLKDGYIANIINDVSGKECEKSVPKILKSDDKALNKIKFADFVSKVDKDETVVNVQYKSDKTSSVWSKSDNVNIEATFTSQIPQQLFSISSVNWWYSDADGKQHLIDKKIGKQVWNDEIKVATFTFDPVDLFQTTGTFKIHCELADPLKEKVLILQNEGVNFEVQRLNITNLFNSTNLNNLNNFFANIGSKEIKKSYSDDLKTFNSNGVKKIAELLNVDVKTIMLGTFEFNHQKSLENHKSIDLKINFNKEYVVDKTLNIKGEVKEGLTPLIARNQDIDNQISISNILTLDKNDSKIIKIETINSSYSISKDSIPWLEDEQLNVIAKFNSDSGDEFNIKNGLKWVYKDLDGTTKEIDSSIGRQTWDPNSHQATFSFNSLTLFKKYGAYQIYCIPINPIKDYVFLKQNNGVQLKIVDKNVTNLLDKNKLNDLNKIFSELGYNKIKRMCLDDGVTFSNDGIKMIAQKIGFDVAFIKSIVLDRNDQVSTLNHLSYKLNIKLVDECIADKNINIVGEKVENIAPKLICQDSLGKVINISGLITKDKKYDIVEHQTINYLINMQKDSINYMEQTNDNVLKSFISIENIDEKSYDFILKCHDKIGIKLIDNDKKAFVLERTNQYVIKEISSIELNGKSIRLDLSIFGQKLDLKPGNYNLELFSTDARFDFKRISDTSINKDDIVINKTIVTINDDTFSDAFHQFSRHAESDNWFDENESCFTEIGKIKFIRMLTGNKLDNLKDETILNKIVKKWPSKGLETYYTDLYLYHVIKMFYLWFDVDYVKFDVRGFTWKVFNPDSVILTSYVELNVNEGKLEVARFALHYKYA